MSDGVDIDPAHQQEDVDVLGNVSPSLPCLLLALVITQSNVFSSLKKNNLSKKSNVDKRSNVLLTARYSLPEGWQRGKTESVSDFTCGAGDRIIQLASNQ